MYRKRKLRKTEDETNRIWLQSLWKRIKPPYAERHVRWCERKGNESRSENFRFPTYSIYNKRLLHQGESLCCFRDSASVTYGGMLPSDLTLSALRFILSAKSGQSCMQDCETVDFCNSLNNLEPNTYWYDAVAGKSDPHVEISKSPRGE